MALAGLIFSGGPYTASWALGLIVGVNLITSGLALPMAALAGLSLVSSGKRDTLTKSPDPLTRSGGSADEHALK